MAAVKDLQKDTRRVPCIINNNEVHTKEVKSQDNCGNHQESLCEYSMASASTVHTVSPKLNLFQLSV